MIPYEEAQALLGPRALPGGARQSAGGGSAPRRGPRDLRAARRHAGARGDGRMARQGDARHERRPRLPVLRRREPGRRQVLHGVRGAAARAAAAIAEERKVVTTLFCDLVAFTAMSEAADPEDVDALLGEYFARATKVIESHGGTVEKFIGDAVVGVFGVPAVHEDDPERAVRAGLRILEALEGMTRPDGTPARGPRRHQHRRGPGASRRRPGLRPRLPHRRRREHRRPARGRRPARRRRRRRAHARAHGARHRLRGAAAGGRQGQGRAGRGLAGAVAPIARTGAVAGTGSSRLSSVVRKETSSCAPCSTAS